MLRDPDRIVTIDELSTPRRRSLLLPPGVLQAKLQHRNDKVTPAAKLIVISAWIDGLFQFGPREFDRAIAYTFAIEQKLFDQAMTLAESHGWLEVDRTNEVVMELTLLEAIYCPKGESSQRRLDLGPSHADIAIEEISIHLGSLRRLFPRKLMGHPNIPFAHKLLFIAERVENGLTSETMHFPLTRLGKILGLDRNTIRAGAEAVAKFTGEQPLSQTGSISFQLSSRLYSRTEIELFERVYRLAFRGDLIVGELRKSVDEEGPSSTVALTSDGSGQQLALTNSGFRQRSETQTVDGEVVSSTVQPQALTKLPPHQRNRSPEALLVNGFVPSVPHNYDYDIDNMSCGRGDEGDEASRVLAREQRILSYANRVDLTETNRYLVRVWALLAETKLIVDGSSRLLQLDADELESFLTVATTKLKNGGYITTCVNDALKIDKSNKPLWRDAAEQASRTLGIPFGREMREVIGGPTPKPITALRSRVPRGGDGLDASEKRRDDRIRQLRQEGHSKIDAVAIADEEARRR